ncbi:MAG TPA: HAD-IB family hydrolase [Anaerolineales bacterium]|nr:HAD-IB family hydrolase [Anaerolineales bacterium]
MVKAAFFDVDGTLTDTHVWEGLMDYFMAHGQRRWTHRAYWATHMPFYFLHKAGMISEGAFRKPWAAHLAWYMRGYSLEQAQPIWDWVVTEFLSQHWRADTRRLLDRHRHEGDLVVLISGGPAPLLERIAGEIGADHVVGTQFEVRKGRYTGRSLVPICLDENKASLAKTYLQAKGLEVDFQASSAYADSVSDLQMLEMVGVPVATYPGESLVRVAVERGWRIFPEAKG